MEEAFGFTYERWNGDGLPERREGRGIPLPMRIVHVSHDMEAHRSPLLTGARTLEAARERRGRTYDPEIADLFAANGERMVRADREAGAVGRGARARTGARTARCSGAELDEALAVAADFIDLKSPYMAGHSRRCAAARRARRRATWGSRRTRSSTLRRAALVHEFGTTGVPNSIWDKPGPLTRAELDRVELHPMLTEQMLRRSPALAG